jgi:hypothetical protein
MESDKSILVSIMAFRAKAVAMGYPSLATAALIGWEWLQSKAHIFIRFEAEHYRLANPLATSTSSTTRPAPDRGSRCSTRRASRSIRC